MQTETTSTKITGPQKAAILLVALGDKLGGEVLKQLNDEEVKAVSKAIARLDNVTPSQTESVLEEFFQLASQAAAARGGFELRQADAGQRVRTGRRQAHRRTSSQIRSPL